MDGWIEYKLNDIARIKHGFAFKGEFFSENPYENILLTPGNFNIGGGFKNDKFKYYKGQVPKDYILNEHDVIITMTDLSKDGDTLGYSALVPKLEGHKFLHNQRIGLLQLTSKAVDKYYLYWLLRTKPYQQFIVGSASGTTVKHTSPNRILDYQWIFPPLPLQKRVAEILSALDEKIELNRQINHTLEQMAQALYKHYFVDDIDPEYLPEGWRIGKLESLFKLQRGFDLPNQNRVYGKFPIYAASGFNGFHSQAMVKGPGVTTGRSGVIGNVFYIMEDFWPLNTSLFVKEFYISTPLHAYYVLKSIDLAGFNSGSAVPTLNRNEVHSLDTIIPAKKNVIEFESIVKSFFKNIKINELEAESLIKIRDTFLPKLISGELIPTDIDSIEEAL